MTHCQKCGALNSADSRYCLHCGGPMTLPAQVQLVTIAKSRGTYIVLGLLLGGLGIHNFYIGRNTPAVIQLVLTLLSPCLFFLPLIAVYVWVIAELFTVRRDGKGDLLA